MIDPNGGIIGISYIEGTPDELIDPFVEEISSDGVEVVREARPNAQMFAAMEWLIPTAVFVFFAKSYIEGILQAAGAAHYQKLQTSLPKFLKRASLAEVTYLGSGEKKLRADNPFTGAISVVADGKDGRGFKLLFRRGTDEAEIRKSIAAFLTILKAFHTGEDLADLVQDYGSIRPVGGLHLMFYDTKIGKLREVDPRK